MAQKTAKKAAPAKGKSKTAAAKSSARQADLVKKFKELKLSPAALLAELLGTFVLALVIVNYGGNVLIAMITLAVLVLVFGQFSGPHFNPAFSIGAWLTRQMSGAKATAFVVAQVLGAMLALVVAKSFLPDEVNPYTGETVTGTLFQSETLPEEAAALWKMLGVEAVGMAIFALGFARVLFTKLEPLAHAITLGGAFLLGLAVMSQAAVLNPALAITLGGLSWDAWSIAIYLAVPVFVTAVILTLYRLMQKDDKLSK